MWSKFVQISKKVCTCFNYKKLLFGSGYLHTEKNNPMVYNGKSGKNVYNF